jgi:hypothetical protein
MNECLMYVSIYKERQITEDLHSVKYNTRCNEGSQKSPEHVLIVPKLCYPQESDRILALIFSKLWHRMLGTFN